MMDWMFSAKFFTAVKMQVHQIASTQYFMKYVLKWIYKWGSLRFTGFIVFFRIAVLSISTPKEKAMAK
jgi:hypothetical protein